jgi:hypothetical protein
MTTDKKLLAAVNRAEKNMAAGQVCSVKFCGRPVKYNQVFLAPNDEWVTIPTCDKHYGLRDVLDIEPRNPGGAELTTD